MLGRLKLFFDGGCRGKDGRIEIAVVAGGRTTIRTDMGRGTSSDAEWLALIEAITIARTLDVSDAVLLGDSADVVAKANGLLPCRGEAARHRDRFRALAAAGPAPRVRRVKRSQNLAGIALEAMHRP